VGLEVGVAGPLVLEAVDGMIESGQLPLLLGLVDVPDTNAAAAEIWELGSMLYLRVLAETRIVHDEHGPISLPVGLYCVWQQREYTPEDIRILRD